MSCEGLRNLKEVEKGSMPGEMEGSAELRFTEVPPVTKTVLDGNPLLLRLAEEEAATDKLTLMHQLRVMELVAAACREEPVVSLFCQGWGITAVQKVIGILVKEHVPGAGIHDLGKWMIMPDVKASVAAVNFVPQGGGGGRSADGDRQDTRSPAEKARHHLHTLTGNRSQRRTAEAMSPKR